MITCDFLGRTGNNLFQVAAMIGLTSKHGGSWSVPSNYHHREIYNYWPHLPKSKSYTRLPIWKEPDFTFTEIPKHTTGVKLHGFFQSIKYFEHCQDEVRHWLKLKETPIEFISLHWRRGDYLNYPDRFPTITLEYIEFAIFQFLNVGYKNFMVFSDDIPHCKSVLPFKFPQVQFTYSEGRNEFEDLSLMASCEHNIIANSSFSWMAAWYNTNKNKIVISPSKETWFGHNNKLDTSDLIPKEWLQIHTR